MHLLVCCNRKVTVGDLELLEMAYTDGLKGGHDPLDMRIQKSSLGTFCREFSNMLGCIIR